MIVDKQELRVAVRNLKIMREALCAPCTQLATSNPRLFEVALQPYPNRIASLQEAIAEYLAQHPEEVSLIPPSINEANSAVTASSPPLQ
jgi:hypothetical protein